MDRASLTYVRQYLADHEIGEPYVGQPFRTRYGHIERVCMWVERLLAQGGVEDVAALRMAAAFHDVGYVYAQEGHGLHSAAVLRAYGESLGLPGPMVERAVFLVSEHSNKERWMPDPDAPRDLILLMEADLLDEEGAMGLALDCMTAGAMGAQSYRDAYERMLKYEPRRLAKNPMVTPLAKKYWQEKQQIIETFLAAYAFDLGIGEEE